MEKSIVSTFLEEYNAARKVDINYSLNGDSYITAESKALNADLRGAHGAYGILAADHRDIKILVLHIDRSRMVLCLRKGDNDEWFVSMHNYFRHMLDFNARHGLSIERGPQSNFEQLSALINLAKGN